jgi:hypothetical protein
MYGSVCKLQFQETMHNTKSQMTDTKMLDHSGQLLEPQCSTMLHIKIEGNAMRLKLVWVQRGSWAVTSHSESQVCWHRWCNHHNHAQWDMLGFSLVCHDIWQGMQTAISGNYVLYQTTDDLSLILTCLLPESNFEPFIYSLQKFYLQLPNVLSGYFHNLGQFSRFSVIQKNKQRNLNPKSINCRC